MSKLWPFIAIFGAAAGLGGCALPPVVVVASYSADIVSYAATGKTVTDHAYSAIARSDCSFIRILKRKPICVDPPPDTAPGPQLAAVPDSDDAPAAPAAAGERYVTIGSFIETHHAQEACARYAPYHPAIVEATVRGRHFHRVIAGPLSPSEAERLRDSLVAAAPEPKPARG
ncbi:MAG: SPOR domain-containing protein [Stellaceae bacterium]